MTSRTNEMPRARESRISLGEKPHWILVAGGALLSSLSIHLGYKLKQALDSRQQNRGRSSTHDRRLGNCQLRSNEYSFTGEEGIHFSYDSANEGFMRKQTHNGHMPAECEGALPLVTLPECGKRSGVMWASSPDLLELPPKPFHNSNSSFSPSVSESGSDIFSKREVVHKLRQQLKRRDEMILEMQDQILELQNTLSSQISHSTHLQSQLDAMNQYLFDSERELQRLRKVVTDHCVAQVSSPNDTVPPAPVWPPVGINGHTNGYHNNYDTTLDSSEKERSTSARIDILQREVGELKEIIETKDYLLQSFKEQKSEMSGKIKELQIRLDSQLPNIF